MTPRLKELYFKKIQTSLKEKFAFKNVYMSPQLQKVVINMGLGLDGNDSKIVKSCQEDLAKIAGQKPVITKFKKSKRFEEIHSLINQLHQEGMGNKEISNYLNSNNIKTTTGKDYTRQLIGMYFYKSRKIERRLKHSELKLTNIRFWISD